MARRWLSFSLPGGETLQVIPGVVSEEEKAMQASITHRQNGSAEYRVAQALEEEAVRRTSWPWLSIAIDVLVTAGIVALLLSIWKPWQ